MNNFIQILTYFRIIAGPIIFCLIVVLQSYGIALSILLLASASDYWDGYLARKYSLTSLLHNIKAIHPISNPIIIDRIGPIFSTADLPPIEKQPSQINSEFY